MRRTGMSYVIVSSMSDLCKWLHNTNIEIIEIVPERSIANEDVVKITYFHLEDQSWFNAGSFFLYLVMLLIYKRRDLFYDYYWFSWNWKVNFGLQQR